MTDARKKAKLAIITPGGITNFGERAIMLGIAYKLRHEHPCAEIAIFGYQDLAYHDKRLHKELTDLNIKFYPLIIRGNSRLIKLLRIIGLYTIPRFFLPRASYNYLKQATVYSKGWESFTQSYGLVHFIDSFIEQFLVTRINKNVILLGHSVGPFDAKFNKLVAYVVKRFPKIYVRDSRSRDLLLRLGYDKQNLTLTKDMAYRAVAEYDLGHDTQSKGHYLIVPNAAICRTPEKTEQYMSNLKTIIETLLEKGERVIVGSSVVSEDWNNDYALCEQLKDAYKDIQLKHYNGLHEFLRDAKSAKTVISSRLHPLIMANGLNTPVLALSESHKIFGLLGDLGLESAIFHPFKQLNAAEFAEQM